VKFNVKVEARNRRERDAIQRALDDKETRVMVIIVGTLLPLHQRGRQRVIDFVTDALFDPEYGARRAAEKEAGK